MNVTLDRIEGKALIHFVSGNYIWFSNNYCLFKYDVLLSKRIASEVIPSRYRLFSTSRILTRALRLGIKDMQKLKSGTILIIADKKIFRLATGKLTRVHTFRHGFGPLRQGWCEDDDGNIYCGEYFLNNRRNRMVNLLKSEDDGLTWKIIFTFTNIRHIHCVQYDPFTKLLWLGTGDNDAECKILVSKSARDWYEIGSGTQMVRTLGFIFTPNYVYWGTDAPSDQNYIFRYERKTKKIDKIVPVDGPVYYSSLLKNGIMLFSTTAEGNIPGNNSSHIWASSDGENWMDVISWKKDYMPYIFGYGMALFAHGDPQDAFYLTTTALRSVDNVLFKGIIDITNNILSMPQVHINK